MKRIGKSFGTISASCVLYYSLFLRLYMHVTLFVHGPRACHSLIRIVFMF